jgi:hypothetical protein
VTDIVERLRTDNGCNCPDSGCDALFYKAADEIERLRSDLEYARKRAEKAEAALERASSPLVDTRNDYEGPGQAPYHPPECGGFQGNGD